MSTIYSITLENQNTLTFVLTRKRMRNIIMRIKPDGTITISAPKQTPLHEITRFITSKLDWIDATKHKLNSLSKLNCLPTTLANDQPLILLGNIYYIQIIRSEIQGVFLQDNKVCLHSRNIENVELLQDIFNKWLNKYTLGTFAQILKIVYPKFTSVGISIPTLKVRRLKSAWGLCRLREQSITLNNALIHTPLSCIEYVALHELTHLKHFNHSKEFYKLLESVCPDWKAQKSLLRNYASVLKK